MIKTITIDKCTDCTFCDFASGETLNFYICTKVIKIIAYWPQQQLTSITTDIPRWCEL